MLSLDRLGWYSPDGLTLVDDLGIRRRINELSPEMWQRLIFSAKESVHKCIYPATKETLDFRDVTLGINRETQSFSVEAETQKAASLEILSKIQGRYTLTDAHIVTSSTIPSG